MFRRRYSATTQPRHSRLPLAVLLTAAMLAMPAAQAAEAVIVEIYQNCELTDTNVVIDDAAVSAGDSAEIKARVAAVSGDAPTAVPQIVQILKRYGVDDVSVSQQGLAGCEPETSGKFVEAIGTYCGPELRHAEVRVDRQMFVSTDEPDGTFEEFLRNAVKRLRDKGIYDRPVVSIENAPDCEESS